MGTLIRLCCFSTVFIIFFGFFCAKDSQARDTLFVDESLCRGEYLKSSNGRFRLNFNERPTGFYLGIHYLLYVDQGTKINVDFIPVWVTLPSVILRDPSELRMKSDGQLVINDFKELHTVNVDQPSKIRNTIATLLDNGNLVLRAGSRTLWQSFDYPGNTWLPGMKIGLFNLNTRKPQQHLLTSWIAEENPFPGAFTLGLDPSNKKELVVLRRGVPYWRSGIWNQLENFTSGITFLPFISYFSYFTNESDSYFSWNGSSFVQLNHMGQLITISNDSLLTLELCPDVSDMTRIESMDVSKGCVTSESSICPGEIPFVAKETTEVWNFYFNPSIGLNDCKEICRRNCSCTAYNNASSDGTGCKFSTSEPFAYSKNGEDMYFLRTKVEVKITGAAGFSAPVAAGPLSLKHQRKWEIKLAIGVTMTLLLFLASSLLRRILFVRDTSGAKRLELGEKVGDGQLLTFSLLQIKIATNNFCDANKLGQGGFGPVYKGKLPNGQEIAVKRLSTVSSHGIEQFKNEVVLISRLQHRNLVSLLGHCTQGEERLLVYEYLPNKSLDSILFDATKQALLDWQMRVNIIQGIAQGLLYLHKYSRLKIIHRDLKTSNILLDGDMNPKISDFGTARIFQDNDSRANTKRIMGTYGYMSPEYAIDGLFSEKSDVFSFGVMVLEIISGKKNTGFYHSNHLNLLGYAWDQWSEGKVDELADPTLSETFCISSGSRYVQVALLCVQENAADRPVMLDVVSMITNESVVLSIPKQPAFYPNVKNGNISANPQTCSPNKLTISVIEAR